MSREPINDTQSPLEWAHDSGDRLAAWRQVRADAAQSKVFRVVVLGSSPTAGCGAIGHGPNPNLCSLTHSWARRMHDALSRAMSGAGTWALPVETRIYAKNAVSADFFARCTREMVPAGTHLVLLETGTNLWSTDTPTNACVLEATVGAVSRAAPLALLAFVLWPHNEARKRVYIPPIVRSVAKRLGVSMIELFEQSSQPWIEDEGANESACRPRCTMYAKRGLDLVHPSAKGHVLLARRVASVVVSSLLKASCDGTNSAVKAARSLPDALASEHATTAELVGSSQEEVCYPSADLLPRLRVAPADQARRGVWSLRDEGGDKGVQKLGLVSSRAGDVLLLELRPDPRELLATRCENTTLRARLGYLVSPAASQGRLHVECHGCNCMRSDEAYADAFPVIDTSLKRSLWRSGAVNIL